MCSAPKPRLLVLERARNRRLAFPFSLASHQPSFSRSRVDARPIVLAPSFLSVSPPFSFPSFRIFGPSREARTLAERRWDSWRREPPYPISLSLSPSLCRCVFHSRFLRNRIENNRNRNQYTRYIAIIRAIVNDNILHLKRRVDSHGAINII